jgi:hypothetical protein
MELLTICISEKALYAKWTTAEEALTDIWQQ